MSSHPPLPSPRGVATSVVVATLLVGAGLSMRSGSQHSSTVQSHRIVRTIASLSPTYIDNEPVAPPFSLRGITPTDRARALECLTAAIYYEAATQGDAGQAAVAQVVLNRVRHPAFPATICGVVYQGSASGGCQFSFACDGAAARAPAPAGWARAARIAAQALNGRVFAGVGLATHYHTFAVTPAWNRSLVMTAAIGAHFFHRWKGYPGTPAAFTRIYRGGEPTAAAAPAFVVAPVGSAAVPATVAVAVPAPPPEPDHLPLAPQVLDKWKDSGTPLR